MQTRSIRKRKRGKRDAFIKVARGVIAVAAA